MRSEALYARWLENEWASFDFDSHFRLVMPRQSRSVRFQGGGQRPSMIAAVTMLHKAPEPPVAYSLPRKTSSILGNHSSALHCPSPDSMAPRSITPSANAADDMHASAALIHVSDHAPAHHVSIYPVASFTAFHPRQSLQAGSNNVASLMMEEARWSVGSAHEMEGSSLQSTILTGGDNDGTGAMDGEQERLRRLYQSSESAKRFKTPPQVSKSSPPRENATGLVVLGAHLATEHGVLFGTPPHQQVRALSAHSSSLAAAVGPPVLY